jgi:hypothetical protein
MSSRTQLEPHPVIGVFKGHDSGVSGNMASNITSLVTVIQKLSLVSYSCTWTGTSPVGTVTVQVSNDYSLNPDGSVSNPGTWNTLPTDGTGSVSGNTGNGFVDVDAQAGYALRLQYTATSGTGTMTAIVAGKVA